MSGRQMTPFFRLSSVYHELQSLDVMGPWNPEKPICPHTQQAIDRAVSWFAGTVVVYYRGRLPDDKQPGWHWDDRLAELNAPRLLGTEGSPMILANQQAKLILEGLNLPLQYTEVRYLPLLERDKTLCYPVDPSRKHYLLQTDNHLEVDLDRFQIEWQKDCPGCGRSYPLLHTMKTPFVHAPTGADARLFAFAQWPDSYIYIDEPTIRLWKELGIRGLKSPDDPFGFLE